MVSLTLKLKKIVCFKESKNCIIRFTRTKPWRLLDPYREKRAKFREKLEATVVGCCYSCCYDLPRLELSFWLARARPIAPCQIAGARARAKGSCNLGHSALFLIWRDAEKDREESERESPTLSLSYPSSSLHQSASFFRRGREPRTHLEIAFAEGEHFLSLSFSTETVTVPTRHGMRSQILYLSTKHSTNFAVILA